MCQNTAPLLDTQLHHFAVCSVFLRPSPLCVCVPVSLSRGGAKYVRPATGCSVYWKHRVGACFQEFDVAAREKLIDKVWWDAAGELAPPASPLGKGALAAYAVRLKIALRRSSISQERGNAVFDGITSETKIDF